MAALSSARVFNSPIGWFLGLWVFTFPIHCLWLVYQWLVDRGVQRELARQSQFLILTEKRKNDFATPPSPTRLRLADDGELIDPFLDAEPDIEKPKREQASLTSVRWCWRTCIKRSFCLFSVETAEIISTKK